MRYKVGDKVRVKKNLKSGTFIGKVFLNPEMKEFFGKVLTIQYKYYDYDRYAVIENGWYWSDEMLEPVTNRSKVGKKAYKTFLKNGGSRNSKGQFSKEEKLKSERFIESVNMHLRKYNIGYFEITKKEELFFYPKKQVIDWEALGSELCHAYLDAPGTLGSSRQEHTKAYFKVFQKLGLIKEGVEI